MSRRVLPTSPPTVEYALTQLGQQFHPVLDSIVIVGRELQKNAQRKKARGEADSRPASPSHSGSASVAFHDRAVSLD